MTYRDETRDLRVEFHTTDCHLSPDEQARFQADLGALTDVVRTFPNVSLHVDVHRQARTGAFHVQTTLRLADQILFTGDRDRALHPAWDRCVRKLLDKAKAHKDRLSNRAGYAKEIEGTRHGVEPSGEPDVPAAERAAAEGDYAAFRAALEPYDDSLERRIGRLVERDPRAARALGRRFRVEDVVDEVYLTAFDSFERRGGNRLRDWLEELIEPSIRALVEHPEIELENIERVRGSAP